MRAAARPVAQNGLCNVYNSTQLKNLSTLNFTASCTGNTGIAADKSWCPTDRHNTQAASPDYVGVYIQAELRDCHGALQVAVLPRRRPP